MRPPDADAQLFDQFRATADTVAETRPAVDAELIREIFDEAATLLHNGLALDGLDGHDTGSVIAGLCADLVATDPGAALRHRCEATLESRGDLHDPEAVWAAYRNAVQILQL